MKYLKFLLASVFVFGLAFFIFIKVNQVDAVAEDTKVMFWPGKVNQHREGSNWVSDPDKVSGAHVDSKGNFGVYVANPNTPSNLKEKDILNYCKKFYPSTVSVVGDDVEESDTWMDRNDAGGPYTNPLGSPVFLYKCIKSSDLSAPSINSLEVSCNTYGGVVTANVSSLGYPDTLSERGICYNTTDSYSPTHYTTEELAAMYPNPGFGSICYSNNDTLTSTGSFEVDLSNKLSSNTTYYFRGYAINESGISYTSKVRCKTSAVYSITFDKNHTDATGSMSAQSIPEGSSAGLTKNAFSRTGYTFIGWAISRNSGVIYKDEASYKMGSSNVTLYAKWVHDDSCSTAIDNPQPSHPGTTINACSFGLYSDIPDITTSGYQSWEWKCGTQPCSTPKYGCRRAYDSNYTLSGYGENGPNNNYGCAGTCANNGTDYDGGCPSYLITFDKNHRDATGSMSTQSIAKGVSANLTKNAFSRDGWLFNGWGLNTVSNPVSYTDEDSYTMGSSNVTLYAQWIVGGRCGTFNMRPQRDAPTSTTENVCSLGSFSDIPDITTSGYQSWEWKCGTQPCSTPKYGCRRAYDSNYTLSGYGENGPNNDYACAGTCANNGTDYPTCTTPVNTCANGATNYPTCTIFPVGSCGLTNYDPQKNQPTGTNACGSGSFSDDTDVTTIGSQAWKWKCGTQPCSAPKYGCTTTTDENYNATGPNNVWSCSLKCANGATNYPTCGSCGLTNYDPQENQPTGTNACGSGSFSDDTDVTTIGSQAWKWKCGTQPCSAPKYGCTTTTDENYNATGPNNVWSCSLKCANGATDYPTCTGSGSCGLTNYDPQENQPTGTNACGSGSFSDDTDVTTIGSQAWKWKCGTQPCSAPKYGCTTTTDENYNATGPNNVWSCSLKCANGATDYPTCTGSGSIDGGWGSWSGCSNNVKIRYCNNPYPSNGGLDCLKTSGQRSTWEASTIGCSSDCTYETNPTCYCNNYPNDTLCSSCLSNPNSTACLCSNGSQDAGETGVDCGGVCSNSCLKIPIFKEN